MMIAAAVSTNGSRLTADRLCTGCEFGDKSPVCRSVQLSNCSDSYVNSTCCLLCADYRAPAETTTSPTTTLSTTTSTPTPTTTTAGNTVVTCKIKHVQKCFRAVAASRGYAVDVKML